MIAYNFDPITHEYTGRETAPENPRRPGEYLLPAHATFTEPPAIREGYARVWDGAAWNYAEDHRGETIWKTHDVSKICDTLGPIPEGWSLIRPDKHLTLAEIIELVYQAKCDSAYGGIEVEQDGQTFTFATDPESIALCNAALIAFTLPDSPQSVDWKVWQNDTPVSITLSAARFREIFAAGMAMIQASFAAESELNAEYAAMSDEQIAKLTESEVTTHIAEAFARINHAVEV